MEQPKLLSHTDTNIAQEIYTLFQESYVIEANLIGSESFPPLARSVSNIQNSKTQFWGFYKNSALATVAEIEITSTFLDIHSFVVSPQFFRQGLANNLLGYLLRSTECNSAIVETASANKPAILLYKKFGFIEEKRWNSKGINKISLRLNLGNKKSDTL